MRPVALTLSGWGPYKDIQTADFAAMSRGGLFLICGATGAGKTTIFDGIAFALYGEVSGTIREKDSLRSDFADAGTATYAELIFTHRDRSYRIVRNPKYDRQKLRGQGVTTEAENGELYCEGELLTAGSSAVTEAVKELLGLDYHQFKQISLIAQGEFMQLLTASSKERTQIFRDIFQTRLYDVIQGLLVRDVKRLAAKAEEVKSRADEVTGAFHIDNPEWEELKARKNRNYPRMILLAEQELEAERAEDRLLGERLAAAEHDARELIRKIENWKSGNRAVKQYEEARRSLQALEAEREKLKAAVSSWTEAYKKLPARQKLLDKGKEELQKLTDQRKALLEWKKKKQALTESQNKYLYLDEDAKHKKADYEFQDDCYKKAAAGILAKELKTGKPCPVCGSLSHPKPAVMGDEVPDEKELKRLKKIYEDAWEAASKAQEAAAVLVGQLHVMEQSLMGILDKEDGKGGIEALEEAIKEKDVSCRELARQIENCRSSYQESVVKLESNKASCTQLKEAMKAPAQQETVDITGPEAEMAELERGRKSLSKAKERIRTGIAMNQQALSALKGHMEAKEKLEAEYGPLRELERAAGGYNGRNLVLEQYVLSVYFDDILSAANNRFLAMTGERYELYRVAQTRDKRSREGMEMEVLDQYTGKKRSVKSLSGGEAFKAALALALGTSDVIQGYCGGTLVETLFVDEGFGSLDTESLDQAVGILSRLSGNNAMVGIISHVEELKEQIENRILVEKTPQGSRILSDSMV